MLVCDIISSMTPHPAHHHDQSENPLRLTRLVGSILFCHLFSHSQGQVQDIISCFVFISSWLVSLIVVFLFLSPQSFCMYFYYPWCWASTIQSVLLRCTLLPFAFFFFFFFYLV
ncbi:hypothetical protein FocTR4_00010099 [Fusarium oxysporum f. sp. cubense]|uniref:Uncharacterized protein n=1 Tax=Fusarium oxysporum f. sp. cubense TaxID=61366 RepID=A0A5C6TA12_FUSOC|nr:hypothetical protein FocTR4_00010099 [Fusarium oxysporum f. sp. cubense]